MANHFITGKSIVNNLLLPVGISIAIAIGYYGIKISVPKIERQKYKYAINTIEDSLKTKDYILAEQKLQSYSAAGKILPEDYPSLETQIKRVRTQSEFDYYIDKPDYINAALALQKVKDSSLFTLSQISDSEKELLDISEESIYKKILATGREEKSNMARIYLSSFPEGKLRKNVINDLLSNDLNKYLNDLKSKNVNYNEIYSKLSNLILELNKYPDRGYFLSGNILNEIYAKTNQYLNYYSETKKGISTENIRIGRTAKFTITGEMKEYSSSYTSERNKAIPIGSSGKIIAFDEDNVFVQFDDIFYFHWTSSYTDLTPYWKDKKIKNIAMFKYQEIEYEDLVSKIIQEAILNKTKILVKEIMSPPIIAEPDRK